MFAMPALILLRAGAKQRRATSAMTRKIIPTVIRVLKTSPCSCTHRPGSNVLQPSVSWNRDGRS